MPVVSHLVSVAKTGRSDRGVFIRGLFAFGGFERGCGESARTKSELVLERLEQRFSILPLDRGRSPSAAGRPDGADCKKSALLCLATRCEPGRFAVRRGQCQDAPVLERSCTGSHHVRP